MSMQTLTRDVDAAVARNSDTYGLALATQARQKYVIRDNEFEHSLQIQQSYWLTDMDSHNEHEKKQQRKNALKTK